MPRIIPRPITQAAAAKKLGVSREHLNRVINGKRESRSLTTKYKALLKQKIAA